jgi:hypothetical protein
MCRKRMAKTSPVDRLTDTGLRRTAAGWAVFLVGLLLLLWLHTFRDRLAHSAILPLFLSMWVGLLACAWDGSKVVAPRWRYVLFSLQLIASAVVGALFFQHLIGQSF